MLFKQIKKTVEGLGMWRTDFWSWMVTALFGDEVSVSLLFKHGPTVGIFSAENQLHFGLWTHAFPQW